MNNIRENQDNRQIVQVTSSASMLIVSLIQQLCTMFEEDKVRRNKLYYGNLDLTCFKIYTFSYTLYIYIVYRERILLTEIVIYFAAICDQLHELKLIDNSYNLMEFEPIRGQYQRALYRLVMVARASTGNENILHTPRYHNTLYNLSKIVLSKVVLSLKRSYQ